MGSSLGKIGPDKIGSLSQTTEYGLTAGTLGDTVGNDVLL